MITMMVVMLLYDDDDDDDDATVQNAPCRCVEDVR